MMNNKKGQFYLIAAIFIVMIMFGTSSIATYATVKPEPRTITEVSEELNRETYNIVEYGILSGTNINSLAKNFSGEDISKYFLKKSEDANIVFVYGDESDINAISVGKEDTGTISIGGTGFNTNNDFSRITSLSDGDGDGFVEVEVLDRNYKFEIKNNQMFYFLIVKERGDEVFVERNKEDKSKNDKRPGGADRNNAGGTAGVPAIVGGPDPDLVSHWSFENNFEDVRSNRDGSGVGDPQFVSGISGKAVSLDGNDNVEVSDSSEWDLDGNGNNKDYSISLHFNANSFTSNWWEGAFISQDEGPGDQDKWILSYDNSNKKFIFHINNPSGSGIEHKSDTVDINLNQWNSLVFVKRGEDYKFYVNDDLRGSGSVNDIPSINAPLRIGYAEGPNKFDGLIDEVKIWKKALNPDEVRTV